MKKRIRTGVFLRAIALTAALAVLLGACGNKDTKEAETAQAPAQETAPEGGPGEENPGAAPGGEKPGEEPGGAPESDRERPAEGPGEERPGKESGKAPGPGKEKAGEGPGGEEHPGGPEATSLQAIYDAVAEEITLPDMYFADDDFLMNYYGIDASLLEDYIFASCEDAARVDSVILMRVRDEKDVQTVTEGLQTLLDQMDAEMENYLPEAHTLVKAAEIRQNGRFLDLVISEEREAILAVIDRMAK